MRRSIFLSIILSLFLVTYIPQAMAQKQSRMEKLLRYLNDNDADKWQKNRDKPDAETRTYYAEELALLDVLNGLWNNKKIFLNTINTEIGLTAILIMNMTIRANGSAGPTVTIRKMWNVYNTFTNKVRCYEHLVEGFCYYSITSQLKLVTL